MDENDRLSRLVTFVTQTIERARAEALTVEPTPENVALLAQMGRTISDLETLKKTLLRHR
jgi:hypothetical protein